jgi:hypothetical protein
VASLVVNEDRTEHSETDASIVDPVQPGPSRRSARSQKGLQQECGNDDYCSSGDCAVIGFSAHFLSSGTDNVFRMVPGEWRLSFQISAVLLVCLEAPGCWIGLRAFPLQREKVRANN